MIRNLMYKSKVAPQALGPATGSSSAGEAWRPPLHCHWPAWSLLFALFQIAASRMCVFVVPPKQSRFCKKFNFLNGKNGASLDDPCSTWNKFYKQNNGDEDMPGQGRSVEDSADHCRERCKGVKHCRHYSFWPNGGCHLQNLDSKMHWEGGSDIKTGPPICCARASTGIDKDMNGQGRSGEPEYEDCLNRCKSVKGCRYFTYWGKDGGCHLGDKYANLQQNDKQGGRVVTADAYCLGSELRHGNVIALHNKDRSSSNRIS